MCRLHTDLGVAFGIAFAVDDEAGEILFHAVTYGGADWMARTRFRHR